MVWGKPWGGGLWQDQIFKGSAIDILSKAFWNPPWAHLHGPCKGWMRLGGGKASPIALHGQATGRGPQGPAPALRMAYRTPPGLLGTLAWLATHSFIHLFIHFLSTYYVPAEGAPEGSRMRHSPGLTELSIWQDHERF